MFNPLHPFEFRLLEKFKKKGVRAFVKLSYKRGLGENTDILSFVMIHFNKLEVAQKYLEDALTDGKIGELLDLDSPADVTKIRTLLQTSKVYTVLKIKDAEIFAQKVLDNTIRAYIENKLRWRPGRGETVGFVLDVQFGEFYATLKYRAQKIRVILEEIEEYVL